jgi:hypothetical protein
LVADKIEKKLNLLSAVLVGMKNGKRKKLCFFFDKRRYVVLICFSQIR